MKLLGALLLMILLSACSGGGDEGNEPEIFNQPPNAVFTQSCVQLLCNFDASTSSDADGSIASYSWTFGDGAIGSGISSSHSYVSAGDYSITLTIIDNQGGNGSTSSLLMITSNNQAPTAAFTQSCIKLICSFDATASSDVDGNIVNYSWDFGDGTSATGITLTHEYSSFGSFIATLTVLDNESASNSKEALLNITLFNGLLVTGTSGLPISAEVLAHPDIAGFLIHQGWKDVETSKGVFDWGHLDTELASAIANNKVVRPALHIGGDDTPKWLYDDLTIPFIFGKDGSTSTSNVSLIFNNSTLTISGTVWPFTIRVGKIVEITGTPNNNGRYRIVSGTTNSVTVEEVFIDESSVSGTITYDVVPSYWDTKYIQHKSDFYNQLLAHILSLGQVSQETMLSFSIQMVGPNTGDWSFKDSPQHVASYNAAGWLTSNEAEKQEGWDNFESAMKLLYDNVVPNISGTILASSAIGPVPSSLLPTGINRNQPADDILQYIETNYPGKLLIGKGALNARTYFAKPCPAIGSPWERICTTPNFLQINWAASSSSLFSANGDHEWDKSNFKATATVLKNSGLNAYTYNAMWFEIWHADVDSSTVLNEPLLQNELDMAIAYIKGIFVNGITEIGAPIAIQSPPSTMNMPIGTKFVLQYVFDYNGEVPDLFEVKKDSMVVGNNLSYTINNPTASDSGLYEISCRNSFGTTTITTQITFQ